MGVLSIELSWPAEELSPNSRAHRMAVARFKKAARIEAGWATVAAMTGKSVGFNAPIPVRIIAHPPKAWRTGDDDNLIARLKAHLDGIAKALEINDRDFRQDGVTWAERRDPPRVFIQLGEAA